MPFCIVYLEPRSQDCCGDPNEEDEDGEEQGLVHSCKKEQEDWVEEERVLPWRSPGQCVPRKCMI